jgi:aminocarboxymuconate-semialdehyde decarboxylase
VRIDLHTHILPATWPDLSSRPGYGAFVRIEHEGTCCANLMIGERLFRRIDERTWDVPRRLSDCDRCGVDMQVLSTVPVMFSYWAQPLHALELAHLLNDHLADTVALHPRRFAGLGTVPLQDPDVAARELERCVRELGLAGVEIGTHVRGRNLDDPALFPFFERAAELGAAIFVHPWDMLAPERMERHWLPWLVGMPAETALAAASLVLGGVIERLPALRVALAHGGGAFPWILGRIQHGFEVRPDLCATSTAIAPREGANRLYLDSLVHDERALRFLIDAVGPDRVALGSDYPFPLGEDCPGALIASLGLPDAVASRLLAGTALEFLGLPSPAPAAARTDGRAGRAEGGGPPAGKASSVHGRPA